MPTRRNRDACAGRAVAASSAVSSDGDDDPGPPHSQVSHRCPAEGGQPACEPLLQIDLRLPAEHLARTRDVGAPDLRVVGRQRFEHDLARRARHLDDGLRELEHRHLVIGVAEVDRQMLSAHREQKEAADQIVDVAERPRLRAVAVDRERLALERLVDEVHRRAAVVAAHARAVRVEDARDRGVDALLLWYVIVIASAYRFASSYTPRGPIGLTFPQYVSGCGCTSGSPYTSLVDEMRNRARFHFARPSALCVPYEPTFSEASGMRM